MSEKARAHDAVTALAVVGSHGQTRSYQGSTTHGKATSEAIFPASGYQTDDDREPAFALKSHAHFVARLKGCRTENDYRVVADDAERAKCAWEHSQPPPKDSKAWRELVGKTPGTVREVAAEWNISPSYAHQLRRLHANAA